MGEPETYYVVQTVIKPWSFYLTFLRTRVIGVYTTPSLCVIFINDLSEGAAHAGASHFRESNFLEYISLLSCLVSSSCNFLYGILSINNLVRSWARHRWFSYLFFGFKIVHLQPHVVT